MRNQTVIKQGQHGTELYLLMSGEAEVTEKRGDRLVQLGFISEGAFFGEAPLLQSLEDRHGQTHRTFPPFLQSLTARYHREILVVSVSKDNRLTLTT